MKPLLILAAVVLAGCGEAKKEEKLHWTESADKAARSLESIAQSMEHDDDKPPRITREQLAGIYRRLVELEKRAGIRDAEGNKIPGATAP